MKKIFKVLCLVFCLVIVLSLTNVKAHAEELIDETPTGEVVETPADDTVTEDEVVEDTTEEQPNDDTVVDAPTENEPTVPIEPEEPTDEPIEEEPVEPEQPTDEPVIEYPCNILEPIVENGTIEFSAAGGEIGDIIEVYPNPDLLFDIIEITANGVILEKDENGIYKFELIEGSNIVTAKFEVSEEKLQQIAGLLQDVKNGDWESIFTVSNLMQVISWVITTICSSGFFVTLYKSKKYKQLTPQDIANQVNDKINSILGDDLTKFLEGVFGPFSELLLEKFDKLEASTKTMVRCFILMQENTPESRVTILKELDSLNSTETNNLTTQIKNLIAEEVKKQEEKNQAFNESIEELKVEAEQEIPHL